MQDTIVTITLKIENFLFGYCTSVAVAASAKRLEWKLMRVRCVPP